MIDLHIWLFLISVELLALKFNNIQGIILWENKKLLVLSTIMAKLNMFSIMVILLVASYTLPTLTPLDNSLAVIECKKYFNITYTFDVYNYIFLGWKIGDNNCWALVTLGRPCHNIFVNNTFTYVHYDNRIVIQAELTEYVIIVLLQLPSHLLLLSLKQKLNFSRANKYVTFRELK